MSKMDIIPEHRKRCVRYPTVKETTHVVFTKDLFILMGQGVEIYIHSAFPALRVIKAFRVPSCILGVLKPRVGNAKGWSTRGFQRSVNSWKS